MSDDTAVNEIEQWVINKRMVTELFVHEVTGYTLTDWTNEIRKGYSIGSDSGDYLSDLLLTILNQLIREKSI